MLMHSIWFPRNTEIKVVNCCALLSDRTVGVYVPFVCVCVFVVCVCVCLLCVCVCVCVCVVVVVGTESMDTYMYIIRYKRMPFP